MKKLRILIFFLVCALILLITTNVNATEIFSTSDGVIVTKKVEGFNGDIDLEISNITLSSEGNYVWGISETSIKDDINKWYPLLDFNINNKTATINLVTSDINIRTLLRKTNTAYLFIKNTNDENFVIDNLELDLTLPPYHAFDLYEWLSDYYITGGTRISASTIQWNAAPYNIANASYKFEKVTDSDIIKKYNEAIQNKTSLENIFSINTDDIENITDWENCSLAYNSVTNPIFTKIDKEKLPKDDALYILYIKAKDIDSKFLYGYKFYSFENKTVTVNDENVKDDSLKEIIDDKTNPTDNIDPSLTQPDTTTAKGILPQTGINISIIISIILIMFVSIFIHKKYKQYKDI